MLPLFNHPKQSRAAVLLSGGLDSCANLAFAKAQGVVIDFAITFDYGQRAQAEEIKAAKKFCNYYDVPHILCALPWFRSLDHTGALLNTRKTLPQGKAVQLDDTKVCQQTAQQVWVPNRNGVFLNIAASFAEAKKVPFLLVGWNEEEAKTFPDNSLGFLNAANQALKFSTRNQVQVESLTIALNKKEIVHLLKQFCPDFPFQWLWSCYEKGPSPCQRCESCLRLLRALS